MISRPTAWKIPVRRVCAPERTATEVRARAAVAGMPPNIGSTMLPDALCEQLLIVVELDAGRAAGGRTAQQALEHVQHRDGERRCQQSRNCVPVNLCRRQTIRQHERFRNLADGCDIELQNHRCRSCDDNADERGRYDRVPLFREEHHQQNDKSAISMVAISG